MKLIKDHNRKGLFGKRFCQINFSYQPSLTSSLDTGKSSELHSDLKGLLSQLADKTSASCGLLLYVHSGTQRAIHCGSRKIALDLNRNQQRPLLMGQPLQLDELYIHPIRNGSLVGLICLNYNKEQWKSLFEDLVDAYALLAAQNIEMKNTQANLTQYANSLLEKKEELEKIQQYNQNLLSITTHDLSSPLNAVSGYLEMIEEYLGEEENSKKIQGYYQRIQSGVNDVSEMLGQLDEVIKFKKGFMELETVNVDGKWLVEDVCEVLKANARQKGIDLEVTAEDSPVFIDVDVVKFKRVVYNLVSNAIKYTNHSSRVSVHLQAEDDSVLLSVKDKGIGISSDKLEVIFEPFVKLDKSSSSNISKGLGLYISSYFIDLMGGEIKAESTAGEGSIFTVTMPRVSAPASEISTV